MTQKAQVDDCIAEIDASLPPLAVVEAVLAQYRIYTLPVRTVTPDGWHASSTGVYVRDKTGQIAILQQAFTTVDVPDLLPEIMLRLGVGGPHEPAMVMEAGGRLWHHYELMVLDQSLDIGFVAYGQGMTFVVVTTSPPEQRDQVYTEAFLPALNAIRPVSWTADSVD